MYEDTCISNRNVVTSLYIGERQRQEQIWKAAQEVGPDPTPEEIESKAKQFEKFNVTARDIELKRAEIDKPKVDTGAFRDREKVEIVGTRISPTTGKRVWVYGKGKPIKGAAGIIEPPRDRFDRPVSAKERGVGVAITHPLQATGLPVWEQRLPPAYSLALARYRDHRQQPSCPLPRQSGPHGDQCGPIPPDPGAPDTVPGRHDL